jgi:hypothetical protein
MTKTINMIIKVIDVNFTSNHNWIFKFKDSTNEEYFIMTDKFYKLNKLKTPISRKELDSLDIGHSISCHFKLIEGLKVVTQIL